MPISGIFTFVKSDPCCDLKLKMSELRRMLFTCLQGLAVSFLKLKVHNLSHIYAVYFLLYIMGRLWGLLYNGTFLFLN